MRRSRLPWVLQSALNAGIICHQVLDQLAVPSLRDVGVLVLPDQPLPFPLSTRRAEFVVGFAPRLVDLERLHRTTPSPRCPEDYTASGWLLPLPVVTVRIDRVDPVGARKSVVGAELWIRWRGNPATMIGL
jgi:hypothetical protein